MKKRVKKNIPRIYHCGFLGQDRPLKMDIPLTPLPFIIKNKANKKLYTYDEIIDEGIPPMGANVPANKNYLPDDSPRFQECVIIKGFTLQKESPDDKVGRIIIEY